MAIEAGANDFEALTHAQNDDIPEGVTGARFITDNAHKIVFLAGEGAVLKTQLTQ